MKSIHSTSQSSSGNETGCQSYPLYQRTIKSNSDKGGGNGSSPAVFEMPPWDTWETVEPPTKRCGMPVHLRHRQDRR